MLLTDDERRKFAEYLRQDAASNNAIADQADKFPHMVSIAKMKRLLATAELVVAKELESAESMSI